MLSQGSPKALILKLRIKATLEFWTFQPPLRRPGLQANTYAGVVHTERENGMRKSAHGSMHTASTCTAGSNGGGARRAGRAYRESIGACRRCRSPAMGMSVPEARTRVTPFESHQLRDIHLDTTRIHSAFAAPKLTLHVSWRRRESKSNAAFGCAADERRAALALSAAAATGLTFKALPLALPRSRATNEQGCWRHINGVEMNEQDARRQQEPTHAQLNMLSGLPCSARRKRNTALMHAPPQQSHTRVQLRPLCPGAKPHKTFI